MNEKEKIEIILRYFKEDVFEDNNIISILQK